MSPEELFCPQHGPYNAALGACPYCGSGGRPGPARPLDDEMPTEAFGARPPSPAGGGSYDGGEDATMAPARKGSGGGGGKGGYEEDATILPERQRRRLDEDEEPFVTVLDRAETGLIGWLIVKSSPIMSRGHIMKIKPGAIWGRDTRKANIIIDDDKVSGLHARIQLKDEQFVLIDLGSANGTWVNEKEAVGPTPLNQDDEIRLGGTTFVLKTLK